jgi:hypothetical protein
MPRRKSSKAVQKRNILIALALIGVVVAGGIAYQRLTYQPLVSTASPLVTDRSDWKVYRDDTYGFEIRYPQDFRVENRISPGVLRERVVSLTLQGDAYYRGSNLVEASVVIGVRQDQYALAGCLAEGHTDIASVGGSNGGQLPAERRIDGVTFRSAHGGEGAAGHHYEKLRYRAIYNNACYEITLFLHSTNILSYEAGTVAEFHRDGVLEKLEQVISTFRFLSK